jgi:hypothetical protein
MWNCHSVQTYPFRSAEITLQKMLAAQKIFVQRFGRVDTARLADLFCPFLGNEKEILHTL